MFIPPFPHSPISPSSSLLVVYPEFAQPSLTDLHLSTVQKASPLVLTAPPIWQFQWTRFSARYRRVYVHVAVARTRYSFLCEYRSKLGRIKDKNYKGYTLYVVYTSIIFLDKINGMLHR